jgi:hypothetical protein
MVVFCSVRSRGAARGNALFFFVMEPHIMQRNISRKSSQFELLHSQFRSAVGARGTRHGHFLQTSPQQRPGVSLNFWHICGSTLSLMSGNFVAIA